MIFFLGRIKNERKESTTQLFDKIIKLKNYINLNSHLNLDGPFNPPSSILFS